MPFCVQEHYLNVQNVGYTLYKTQWSRLKFVCWRCFRLYIPTFWGMKMRQFWGVTSHPWIPFLAYLLPEMWHKSLGNLLLIKALKTRACSSKDHENIDEYRTYHQLKLLLINEKKFGQYVSCIRYLTGN